MRRRLTAGLTATLVLGIAGCGSVAAPSAATPASPAATPASTGTWGLSALPTIGTPADDGARIVAVETLGDRVRDLTIESPSVGTVQVRLLLPATLVADPAARFPALYLLHGGDGEYSDWAEKTSVAALTAPTDLLVVMPAAATSFMGEEQRQGSGPGGSPEWLPFHATELTQLMERNWQASDVRALAGLSLGGYASVLLAARNPGRYRAVASYSGALDIKGLVDGALTGVDKPSATRIQAIIEAGRRLGSYSLSELAPLLRGTGAIFVSYGNGQPGPLDPPDRRIPSPLERWCGGGSSLFVAELRKAGIRVTEDAYGDGTHSWEYWDRELRESLPLLLEAMDEPVPAELASPGA